MAADKSLNLTANESGDMDVNKSAILTTKNNKNDANSSRAFNATDDIFKDLSSDFEENSLKDETYRNSKVNKSDLSINKILRSSRNKTDLGSPPAKRQLIDASIQVKPKLSIVTGKSISIQPTFVNFCFINYILI